jgi:hypothetical protein
MTILGRDRSVDGLQVVPGHEHASKVNANHPSCVVADSRHWAFLHYLWSSETIAHTISGWFQFSAYLLAPPIVRIRCPAESSSCS